jgi:hypothetical protein
VAARVGIVRARARVKLKWLFMGEVQGSGLLARECGEEYFEKVLGGIIWKLCGGWELRQRVVGILE